jgi:hypothetical protein
MSSGEAQIVTDREEIRQIEEEEAFKAKYRGSSFRDLPLKELWFSRKANKSEVDSLLIGSQYHIDGYFMVRPSDYRDAQIETFLPTFTLCLMFNDNLQQYRIFQVS